MFRQIFLQFFGKLDSLITLPFFSVTTKRPSLITKIFLGLSRGANLIRPHISHIIS
jgi:hypothetical protein